MSAKKSTRPMPKSPHHNPKGYPANARPAEPEPIPIYVLPKLAPLMSACLTKLLNTKDGTERSVDSEEIFATTIDGVTLNGDDHQVLGFLKGALHEAMVARLRGER